MRKALEERKDGKRWFERNDVIFKYIDFKGYDIIDIDSMISLLDRAEAMFKYASDYESRMFALSLEEKARFYIASAVRNNKGRSATCKAVRRAIDKNHLS